MNNEEIVFNPQMPFAHYETGHQRFLNFKSSVSICTAIAIIAFIPGLLSVIYSPAAMAFFFLTALPFTLLALIGCHARRPKMCLFSMPLALIAGISAVVADSLFSFFGLIAYLGAAFFVFKAANDISSLVAMKELPGYPVFDTALDQISFAAKDEIGADELFSDEPVVYEEVHGKRFIEPMEPSENMEEILTESTGTSVTLEKNQFTAYETEMAKEISDVPEDLRDEVAISLGHIAPNLADYEKTVAEQREENSDHAYEKMVMLQEGKNNNNISDVDLFG
ncbi:MAG: hypothetical protein IJZ61_02790 [Oscillospiraceae bacterium]|nr:hypothetical protein [Oscillospiraceae bacterium]